jgi:hypothetical protein
MKNRYIEVAPPEQWVIFGISGFDILRNFVSLYFLDFLQEEAQTFWAISTKDR